MLEQNNKYKSRLILKEWNNIQRIIKFLIDKQVNNKISEQNIIDINKYLDDIKKAESVLENKTNLDISEEQREELEREKEELKAALAEQESKVTEYETKVTELEDKISELENKLEELSNLEEQRAELEREKEELRAALDEQESKVTEYETKVTELEDKISELEGKLEELSSLEEQRAELEREKEELTAALNEQENKVTEYQGKVTKLESELENKLEELSSLEEQKAELEREKEELTEEIMLMDKNLQDLELKLEKTTQEKELLQSELNILKEKVKQDTKLLDEVIEKYKKLTEEILNNSKKQEEASKQIKIEPIYKEDIRIKEISEKIVNYKEKIKNINILKNECTEEINLLMDRYNELSKQKQNKKTIRSQNSIMKKIENIKQKIDSYDIELNTLNFELEELISEKDKLEKKYCDQNLKNEIETVCESEKEQPAIEYIKKIETKKKKEHCILLYGGTENLINLWENKIKEYLAEFNINFKWIFNIEEVNDITDLTIKGLVILKNINDNIDYELNYVKTINIPYIEHTISNITRLQIDIFDNFLKP